MTVYGWCYYFSASSENAWVIKKYYIKGFQGIFCQRILRAIFFQNLSKYFLNALSHTLKRIQLNGSGNKLCSCSFDVSMYEAPQGTSVGIHELFDLI